ncbi:DNA-packaging protein, partial [Bacillus toyonensis]
WHENREVVGKAEQLAFSLQSILVQLQYCEGDST